MTQRIEEMDEQFAGTGEPIAVLAALIRLLAIYAADSNPSRLGNITHHLRQIEQRADLASSQATIAAIGQARELYSRSLITGSSVIDGTGSAECRSENALNGSPTFIAQTKPN